MIRFDYLLFLLLLTACINPKKKIQTEKDMLIRINDRILTKREVESKIPFGFSSTDSAKYAENIVKKWIKEELIYDVATQNLKDEMPEINRLVKEYRRSLLSHRYRELLIKEKLEDEIKEEDLLKFYEEYPEKFTLDNAIVKGLFLKIHIDAPKLNDVKKWYHTEKAEDIERIEKYSIQNALIYEFFYDRWVDFGDVIHKMPINVDNEERFLKRQKSYEVSDSTFCYLLHVQSYIPAGEQAPYDYARQRVKELLVNKRKLDFLKNMEEDLYNDGIWRGKVEIFEQRK